MSVSSGSTRTETTSEWLSDTAEIEVIPVETAVTDPEALTEATPGSSDVHTTSAPATTEPKASSATALSVAASPGSRSTKESGDSANEATA